MNRRAAYALPLLLAWSPSPARAAMFTVTSTNDSGAGSLRQAITDANLTTDQDTIEFSIGTGIAIIRPLSPLPTVMNPILLDGTKQPGFAGVPLVCIDGSLLSGAVNGIELAGHVGSRVKGMAITGFQGVAVAIRIGAGGHHVIGNFIGTQNGTELTGPPGGGILCSGSSANTIGGATAAEGNLIVGSTGKIGVIVEGGTDNMVLSNRIGTNAAGTATLGALGIGLEVLSSPSTIVRGNLIAGATTGVTVLGSGLISSSAGTVIAANFVGTDAFGTGGLGNQAGIAVNGGSGGINQITIGGDMAGDRNVISGNAATGISIENTAQVRITGNSIFANQGLGIDLGRDGITVNDGASDPDTGPNLKQNFPIITAATGSPGNTSITATIDVALSGNYTVEFFASSAPDPSGNGEGETFLLRRTVTSSGPITVDHPAVLPTGSVVTATLTDPNGNTSEFSNAFTVSGETATTTTTTTIPGTGSTSSTSSTTSTTLPSSCLTNDLSGALCLIDLLPSGSCTGVRLSKKITTPLAAGRKSVVKAQGLTGKRAKRAVKGAGRSLTKANTAATKAQKKGTLTGSCATAVIDLLGRTRTLLQTIAGQL